MNGSITLRLKMCLVWKENSLRTSQMEQQRANWTESFSLLNGFSNGKELHNLYWKETSQIITQSCLNLKVLIRDHDLSGF